MENNSTYSQLPTALGLGNTVTTDEYAINENFNKHFSTAGHSFHMATPTPVNCPAPSTAAVYHSAIRFVTKAPYTTHHCDLYALVGWPSLHIRRQTHWL